jgi:hypothetical protein
MMHWIIMLTKVASHIGVTRLPTYIALVLFNPVFGPVESHVHGFGALWSAFVELCC